MEGSIENDKNQFVILSSSDIQLQMKSKVVEIQSKVPISTGYCRVLLQKENWNLKNFLEKFPITISPLTTIEDGECKICCEKGVELIQYCCLVACEECWVSYIAEKVVNHKTSIIECLKCEHLISDEIIEKFLANDTENLYLYEKLKLSSYVKSQKDMVHCPKCPNIIRFFSPKVYITCLCGTKMCTKCFHEPHDPISCENLLEWKKACRELSENPSMQWIMFNTKDCPNCYVTIERENGCDVVRCSNCQLRFCWKCLVERSLSITPHFCKPAKDRNRRRNDYRLRYYYDGYAKYFRKLEKTTNKVLRESQTTLQMTYPFAYFLTGTNQEFRELLNTLETKTDQLEAFLNQEGPKDEEILEEKCKDLETQRRQLLDYCRKEDNVWDTVDTVEMDRAWIVIDNDEEIVGFVFTLCIFLFFYWPSLREWYKFLSFLW